MKKLNISTLTETFDLVYSSLAFHFIEDFSKLINNIYGLLNKGCQLLYSQEHPIMTSTIEGGHFNRNKQGERISYIFSNYNQSGKREDHWFVDGVIKYHRPMGEVLTTIAEAGFYIENVCEPTPKDWAVKKLPSIIKEFLKPNFLIFKEMRRY